MTDPSTKELSKLRRIGYFTIFGLVLTFVIWGTIAKLNGAVIASGALEVASYRQIVQHQEGGRVEELFVKNGDIVKVGDVILTLDASNIRPEYEIYNRVYLESLAEKGRLVAERDKLSAPVFPDALIEIAKADEIAKEIMIAQDALFVTNADAIAREKSLLDERAAQTINRISGAQSQMSANSAQADFLATDITRSRNLLSQGLIGKGALSDLEREFARVSGEKSKLESDIAALRDEQSSIAIESLKLDEKLVQDAVTRLRELETREVESFQRSTSLKEKLEQLEIRAPISGVIYGMSIFNSNTVVQPAEPLLYIVPEDSQLLVRARIASNDVNDVFIGQDTELKFAAFNQRTIPYVSGTVKTVSADAFTDEQNGFRYYEIEVEPEAGIVDKLGSEQLMPGQPVDVFIHTGARTFLDYLIKPLKDNFDRAFRED